MTKVQTVTKPNTTLRRCPHGFLIVQGFLIVHKEARGIQISTTETTNFLAGDVIGCTTDTVIKKRNDKMAKPSPVTNESMR